jgi:sterol desaturase/sphingolipid hydroxylase (fatty acid hydroxylase superfamily)
MNENDWLLNNELPIRLGFFFGVFAVITVWEMLAPRRKPTISKSLRWTNNLALIFLNNLVLRLLFPAAALGIAVFASKLNWGILNYYQPSFWLSVIVAVIVMDLVIYLQHVMMHAIPLLWRLHRVHHADLDYDVTTGARFHTLEIIVSALIKFAAILLLGPPLISVIIFEVLLNATSMFNHGNIKLPRSVDRFLRYFLVTPDMHRVHHSIAENEANSNFGFNLSWWDFLFGTYQNQPKAGHQGMTIGIHKYRDPNQVNRLPGMLLMPFTKKITGYVINRRGRD